MRDLQQHRLQGTYWSVRSHGSRRGNQRTGAGGRVGGRTEKEGDRARHVHAATQRIDQSGTRNDHARRSGSRNNSLILWFSKKGKPNYVALVKRSVEENAGDGRQ